MNSPAKGIAYKEIKKYDKDLFKKLRRAEIEGKELDRLYRVAMDKED